ALARPITEALVEDGHLLEAVRGELRRELAGLGVRARAVADEPRVARELREVWVRIVERHADRAGDVLAHVVARRARIEDRHPRAVIELVLDQVGLGRLRLRGETGRLGASRVERHGPERDRRRTRGRRALERDGRPRAL